MYGKNRRTQPIAVLQCHLFIDLHESHARTGRTRHVVSMICHPPSPEQCPQLTHSKTRTKNAKIAVCVFPKSGTGIFSLWRGNFSLSTPKAKSFRAMFSATTSAKILARKLIGYGISCIRSFNASSQSVRSSHLSVSAFQAFILAKRPLRSSNHE